MLRKGKESQDIVLDKVQYRGNEVTYEVTRLSGEPRVKTMHPEKGKDPVSKATVLIGFL